MPAGPALAAEIGGRGGKALSVRADVGNAREAGCLVMRPWNGPVGSTCWSAASTPRGRRPCGLRTDRRGRRPGDGGPRPRRHAVLAPAEATGSGGLVERVGALARALADRNIRSTSLVPLLPIDGDPAKLVNLVLFAASYVAGPLTGQCLDAADAPLAVTGVDA